MCKHQIVGKENFHEFAWKVFRFKFKFRDFPRVIFTLPRTARLLFSRSVCVARKCILFKLLMSMLDAFVISRMKDVKNQEDLTYRKSSIKLPRGLIYFKPIWGGGVNRDGRLI